VSAKVKGVVLSVSLDEAMVLIKKVVEAEEKATIAGVCPKNPRRHSPDHFEHTSTNSACFRRYEWDWMLPRAFSLKNF
jgi:hypothetical protein